LAIHADNPRECDADKLARIYQLVELLCTPERWNGMVALYQEGCKQQPGHSSDMMRDFAKQFVWTTAMVNRLVAGIADSKDGEAAEEAMQTLVD
jgi:hypothetical protein